MTMSILELRTQVLQAHGAGSAEVEELLAYNQNVFDHHSEAIAQLSFPLVNEPHIAAWQDYVETAQYQGARTALISSLVQFQFPIQSGISTTADYQLATRKGQRSTRPQPGLELQQPEQMQVSIHSTLAGAIPVITVGCRADFVSLIQAFTKRNEPVKIPDSMGACIIGGYNNWDRVNRYRQQWAAENPGHCSEQDWLVEFTRLVPRKELYQDRFVILSRGFYSNVAPASLGLTEFEWLQLSLTIRLEHECIHYFTRRCFNSMRNNVLDELIADYCGIVAAIGQYRADWFLHFIGLEAFPTYREGGRLQAYRGNPLLSNSAFQVLRSVIKSAAENLEQFDCTYFSSHRTPLDQVATLIALTTLTLEQLASVSSASILAMSINFQKERFGSVFV